MIPSLDACRLLLDEARRRYVPCAANIDSHYERSPARSVSTSPHCHASKPGGMSRPLTRRNASRPGWSHGRIGTCSVTIVMTCSARPAAQIPRSRMRRSDRSTPTSPWPAASCTSPNGGIRPLFNDTDLRDGFTDTWLRSTSAPWQRNVIAKSRVRQPALAHRARCDRQTGACRNAGRTVAACRTCPPTRSGATTRNRTLHLCTNNRKAHTMTVIEDHRKPDITLKSGAHKPGDDMCLVEYVAWVGG